MARCEQLAEPWSFHIAQRVGLLRSDARHRARWSPGFGGEFRAELSGLLARTTGDIPAGSPCRERDGGRLAWRLRLGLTGLMSLSFSIKLGRFLCFETVITVFNKILL